MEALCPAVLTAKGYQSNNLMDSFEAWKRHTENARNRWAKGVPAWFFYLAVGTFGEKPEVKMVGKGAQSPITPIRLAMVPIDSEEMLERIFVGQEAADQMVDYINQAQEWLHGWDQERFDQFAAQNTEPTPVQVVVQDSPSAVLHPVLSTISKLPPARPESHQHFEPTAVSTDDDTPPWETGSEPVSQDSFPTDINKAMDVIIPEGMILAGKTLGEAMVDDKWGRMVMEYLSGTGASPSGQKFDVSSAPEAHQAAKLLLENMAPAN